MNTQRVSLDVNWDFQIGADDLGDVSTIHK